MVFGLFSKNAKQQHPRTNRGDRLYVIGDVHGRYDLLLEALDRIERHHGARPMPEALYIVMLGDLVDRGPESARVLDYVHRVQSRTTGMVVIKGNHEEMMVRAADGEPGLMRAWIKSGGDDTLRSFGIAVPKDETEIATATTELKRKIAPMLDWLRTLPLTAQSGDYLFCHAGVRPGVPIKKQTRDDLLWIREEFLSNSDYHGAMIVHGHSVSTELEMRPNRIGIDTGAYRSGVLSVLYLEDDAREVLSIRESDLPAAKGDAPGTARSVQSDAARQPQPVFTKRGDIGPAVGLA